MLEHDETEILSILEQIPRRLRATFAAACAERLLPIYISYHVHTGAGHPETIQSTLEFVWRSVLAGNLPDNDPQQLFDHCMAAMPEEDNDAWPWTEEWAYAEDAAAAVAYSLRALTTGASQDALWASQRAYDSACERAEQLLAGSRLEALPHNVINAHAIVQRELARQRRDLDELTHPPQGAGLAQALDDIRIRAQSEARDFLGDPD